MKCPVSLMNFCQRLGAILANAHKTSLSMYYSYLVAGSVIAQESWANMEDYIPVRVRHAVLGVATAVVIADKIHRAAKATRPPDDSNQA